MRITLPYLTCLALSLLLAACANKQLERGPVNEQGLSDINNSSFDQLQIRPGVDFKQYKKVKIEALEVSYEPRRGSDSLNRGKDAFEFDERELAMFNKQFVKGVSAQWQKRFGWALTEETGEGVIVVKTDISKLYLYASIKNNEILPHQTVVNESSKMVIQLSLLDGKTGELLLTSQGKKKTGIRGTGVDDMTLSSSVRYWSDAHQAFRQWASLLGSEIQNLSTSD